MTLSLIVALTYNGRVIGRAGGLPWRLSADLVRFKRLTMGHHLIMGRKTYESIGRPLPGRTSIVVTRQGTGDRGQETGGSGQVLSAKSLEEALALARNDSEVFVIGGGEIFREALATAHRAYVTWVWADLEGDTFFPEFPTPDWVQLSDEYVPADEKNEHPTRYRVYERRSS